jgi:hypothetical protein
MFPASITHPAAGMKMPAGGSHPRAGKRKSTQCQNYHYGQSAASVALSIAGFDLPN